MYNEMFNLDIMTESYDDIMNQSIEESTDEFAGHDPSTNRPDDDFDTDCTSAKETSISVPSKITLTTKEHDEALAALKKSFKEAYNIIGMLEGANVVEMTIEEKQNLYIESVLDNVLLKAYDNGPIYEAVNRDDKEKVKSIVNKIRPKLNNMLNTKNKEIMFYKPNLVARAITGVLGVGAGLAVLGYAGVGAGVAGIGAAAAVATNNEGLANTASNLAGASLGTSAAGGTLGALSAGNLSAAFKQIWSTRLWQVLGICIVESDNIKEVTNKLNDEFESELGDYKILSSKAPKAFVDAFRVKFNWKNNKDTYFLLVDKKVPKELVEFEKMINKADKEDKKNAKSDNKNLTESFLLDDFMESCDDE